MHLSSKVRLAALIATRYLRVARDLRLHPLQDVVARHSVRAPGRLYRIRTLTSAVDRVLVLPWRRLRCLPRAVVLYSLLVDQGHDARLVIGLPPVSQSPEAHAWVEIEGTDVGPYPGREGRQELISYPVNGPFEPQGQPEE